MGLTTEQKNIIFFKFSETDTLLVNALAGTGKTFTLNEFANQRPHSSILYLAFNRAIADEAKQKMVSNVHVSTCHALAFKAIGKNYKDKLTNNLKAIHICEAFGNKVTYKEAHLVNLSLNGFFQSNANTIHEFFEHSPHIESISGEEGVDFEKITHLTYDMFNKMVNKETNVTHNFYLKLYQLKKYQLRFDYVLLDEAQDANDVILDIISNQTHSKKVIVGDHFQQIYKWNGSIDALRKIAKARIMNYKPQIMYLTQSFRCSDEATKYANQYLRILNSKVNMKPFAGDRGGNHEKAIISRTNAKLFDTIINSQFKKVCFLGGFDSYKFEDLVDIYNLKRNMKNRIQNHFYSRFGNMSELSEYARDAKDIEVETKLNIVSKYDSSIEKFYYKLQDMSSARGDCDTVVTTAHKAKGQEFTDILLTDDYVNIQDVIVKAKQIEKENKNDTVNIRKEEFNILYVAYTRSLATVESSIPIPTSQNIMEFRDLADRYYIKIT